MKSHLRYSVARSGNCADESPTRAESLVGLPVTHHWTPKHRIFDKDA